MPKPLFVVALVLSAFQAFQVQSQVSKSLTSAKFNVPKVSRAHARIVCPGQLKKDYPYEALGIKLGDPFALTYKNYRTKDRAFSVEVGKPSASLYNRYFRSSFNSLVPDSIRASGDFQYLGHKVVYDWVAEAKLHYQWDARRISKGLQFYSGLGWQLRTTKILYEYRLETTIHQLEEKRLPQGPVVNAGLEYANFSLPISAFIEMEWVMDVAFDKGYNRMMGGVGLRYVY
jgi:hypothetical protein